MSSPFHHHAATASSLPHRPGSYRSPGSIPSAPPGTFASGTKVQVGNHRVVIEKYLSEGGFAHVYLVRVPGSGSRSDVAVLKRVAVPDKEALMNMRTEVDTMKKLKGHRHIVTYIDSHASQLKGGGYEVFLLMEYCAGGGLIDFMNTRLQHRLTEPEILHIFSDVAEGVACMHYLKPPLLHRDLKVENVLISTSGSSRMYKLCDFGSAAPPRPAAKTAAEGRLIEDDVQRHTTLQYRSPEMIDVYRKQPIDEKSDIWALGVLLYKLCYYTTPFEEQGQMAILNASFRFPQYPVFSDRIKKLTASMLRENPQHRPNIYQVVCEVCSVRGKTVPIKDIYASRTPSEAQQNEQLPLPDPQAASAPVVGLHKSAPVKTVQVIPDITPMRRGRPTAPVQHHASAQPSPSPMRGSASDPFAALDSSSAPVRAAAVDELSARFPSLDEFSLLHDRGAKYQFEPTSTTTSPAVDPKQEALNKRVTEALADSAFAQPPPPPPPKSDAPAKVAAALSRSASTKKPKPAELPSELVRQSQPPIIHQPSPQKPTMISKGTMTSPSASPPSRKYSDASKRPIYRFPPLGSSSHHRASSQPRVSDSALLSSSALQSDSYLLQRPGFLELSRSKSQQPTLVVPKSPASSRPSLEGSRPSPLDLGDAIGRSKSANANPRPSSIHVESSLDYLRDRESSRARTPGGFRDSRRVQAAAADSDSDSEPEDKNIASNVEFLRSMEEPENSKKKDRRSSSGAGRHGKRASLPSLSLSNTKNILAGKFGDAFRRFENSAGSQIPRTPSPSFDRERDRSQLTPIAGSEATGGRSDDGSAADEPTGFNPEVRRELERRRLSQEEKRVAEAAAEYRKRLAEGKPAAGMTRASTIQNRVKELLDDSKAPAIRTAEGYGRFTDQHASDRTRDRPFEEKGGRSNPPIVTRKPLPGKAAPPPSVPVAQRNVSRPSAPPKPRALRTGGAVSAAGTGGGKPSPVKPATLVGRPMNRADPETGLGGGTTRDSQGNDDWETTFAKKYPRLSLELVEADIGRGPMGSTGTGMRIRDV